MSFYFKATLAVHKNLEVTVPAAFFQPHYNHALKVTISVFVEAVELHCPLCDENQVSHLRVALQNNLTRLVEPTVELGKHLVDEEL